MHMSSERDPMAVMLGIFGLTHRSAFTQTTARFNDAESHRLFRDNVGMSAPSDNESRQVKCRVAIKTEDGETTYDGLFPSTCDAVIDAQNRVGLRPCKVSVKALP